jgi:hypothetical protein
MPFLNQLIAARDSAMERKNTAGAAQAQRLLDEAQKSFDDALKMYHNNVNKTTGDQRTPRKSAASGSVAGSSSLAASTLEEMQRVRRSGNTIAVAGREVFFFLSTLRFAS